MKAGYVAGHESRILALKYVESDENFTGPLRSRFAEIVVDEAQDCSMTDLPPPSGLGQDRPTSLSVHQPRNRR